jgi:hypothetical protein
MVLRSRASKSAWKLHKQVFVDAYPMAKTLENRQPRRSLREAANANEAIYSRQI